MNTDLQTATSAAYRDIQQQKAQRDAEQAALRAERLQAAADQARAEGERAITRADEMDRNASHAQSEAHMARQGLQSAEGFEQLGESIGELRQQLDVAPQAEVIAAPSPSPTFNLQGEVTGQNIYYVA